MKMIINIPLLFCLAFVFTCRAQDKELKKRKYNAEAVELNNIAMQLFSVNKENRDSILKSVDLLEKAILNDTYYDLAYSNKATLLSHLGKYKEAINTLDKILQINPSIIELKTFKGFLLEKSGNLSEATEIYKDVLLEYNKKLVVDSNNISIKLNKAFLYFFIEGYDRGIKEFEVISDLYPNSIEVLNMNPIFRSFDRQTYIESICSNLD